MLNSSFLKVLIDILTRKYLFIKKFERSKRLTRQKLCDDFLSSETKLFGFHSDFQMSERKSLKTFNSSVYSEYLDL